MTDIWSDIGHDLSVDEGPWLYRQGEDVCGPLPHKALVDKLLAGEIELQTLVAREKTRFYPLHQVKAFLPYLEEAQQRATVRLTKQHRKRSLWLLGCGLLILSVGGFWAQHEYSRRVRLREQRLQKAHLTQLAEEKQAAKVQAAQAAALAARARSMHLVALVSLGDVSDVHIRRAGTARLRRGARRAEVAPQGSGSNDDVETCKLTQKDIFGTLRASLSRINVCVEDEKKRDVQHLLPNRLGLQFVVRPSGKVADFVVDDRHYRAGPLNNCLTKAFALIAFPESNGANCPVSIPVKIGP